MIHRNPEFNYYLITDKDGEELIQQNFGIRVLNAYSRLKNGAAKGDFKRYVALYVYGGVYLDLDDSIHMPLIQFMPRDKDFVFFIDTNMNLIQCFFMISQRNRFMKKVIFEMVKRIENNEQNIFVATGPTLFNDVYMNILNNTQTIYNSYFTIDVNSRASFFMQNINSMGGLLLEYRNYETILISKLKGYKESMMYDEENPKYEIVTMSDNTVITSNLYVSSL